MIHQAQPHLESGLPCDSGMGPESFDAAQADYALFPGITWKMTCKHSLTDATGKNIGLQGHLCFHSRQTASQRVGSEAGLPPFLSCVWQHPGRSVSGSILGPPILGKLRSVHLPLPPNTFLS